MTDKEAMKLAFEALKSQIVWFSRDTMIGKSMREKTEKAITALEEALAQPEQKMVMWPCLIDTADFSKGTVTIVMQCEDYKVSAGTHWLSTTQPKETK